MGVLRFHRKRDASIDPAGGRHWTAWAGQRAAYRQEKTFEDSTTCLSGLRPRMGCSWCLGGSSCAGGQSALTGRTVARES